MGGEDPSALATLRRTRSTAIDLKAKTNCCGRVSPSALKRGRSACVSTRREGGWSLVELSISLFLVISIAVFGLQTLVAGWNLQNWSIMQSLTDAYAGIETAYAQRWTFAAIPTSNRWPVYPMKSGPTVVTIGTTPKGQVTASVVRTSHSYTDPLTGAQSYMLESYVTYKDHLRQYCKVSKVYRDE